MTTPESRSPSMTPLCEHHRKGELEFPDVQYDDMCVACRISYLEAQEGLLEEWQQRAKKAEDDIKDMERPLDAQMAKLNAEVTRLNVENELLRSASRRSETERNQIIEECAKVCDVYREAHKIETYSFTKDPWHNGEETGKFRAGVMLGDSLRALKVPTDGERPHEFKGGAKSAAEEAHYLEEKWRKP